MAVAEALGALVARLVGGPSEAEDKSVTSQLLRLLRNEKVNYNVRMTVAETLGSLGACPEPGPEPCPEQGRREGRRGSRRDKSIASRLLAILAKKKIELKTRIRSFLKYYRYKYYIFF